MRRFLTALAYALAAYGPAAAQTRPAPEPAPAAEAGRVPGAVGAAPSGTTLPGSSYQGGPASLQSSLPTLGPAPIVRNPDGTPMAPPPASAALAPQPEAPVQVVPPAPEPEPRDEDGESEEPSDGLAWWQYLLILIGLGVAWSVFTGRKE